MAHNLLLSTGSEVVTLKAYHKPLRSRRRSRLQKEHNSSRCHANLTGSILLSPDRWHDGYVGTYRSHEIKSTFVTFFVCLLPSTGVVTSVTLEEPRNLQAVVKQTY